eukprot:CAMPEP_0174829566 /NCGR_PEP_ID=MMETSP1114-20130205/1997_1 /TAXON_ID=312471 /ORGANISM="Neobodo designis, Strain CCAP 1951/1" /LENGTH=53 /DNA_ID=CAMNT_0016063319 /DNA_START=15 /DNA_END=173 /DNA_ORIENTATION=-
MNGDAPHLKPSSSLGVLVASQNFVPANPIAMAHDSSEHTITMDERTTSTTWLL